MLEFVEITNISSEMENTSEGTNSGSSPLQKYRAYQISVLFIVFKKIILLILSKFFCRFRFYQLLLYLPVYKCEITMLLRFKLFTITQ